MVNAMTIICGGPRALRHHVHPRRLRKRRGRLVTVQDINKRDVAGRRHGSS